MNGDNHQTNNNDALDAARDTAAMEDVSNERRRGVDFEIVESGDMFVVSLTDPMVADLFPRTSRYFEDDGRLAYSIGRWVDIYGRPTKINEFWAPRTLVRHQELAGIEWEYQVDEKIKSRGVERGAVKVKEHFSLWMTEEREQELLRLAKPDKVLHVWREFYDDEANCLVYQREVLCMGESTGHVRVLPRENRGSYEW